MRSFPDPLPFIILRRVISPHHVIILYIEAFQIGQCSWIKCGPEQLPITASHWSHWFDRILYLNIFCLPLYFLWIVSVRIELCPREDMCGCTLIEMLNSPLIVNVDILCKVAQCCLFAVLRMHNWVYFWAHMLESQFVVVRLLGGVKWQSSWWFLGFRT